MQIARASEVLSGLSTACILACVVHDDDREREAPLELTNVGEELRDRPSIVLVDGMEPYQRIEEKEPRPQAADGLQKQRSVPGGVQGEPGRGDHVEVDRLKGEAAVTRHALDPFTHDLKCVLGEVDKRRPALMYSVGVEGRGARGDAERNVEPEP